MRKPKLTDSKIALDLAFTVITFTLKNYFMNTLIPLISSGVSGPLGVLHLPRLWLKASLEARGLLANGYPGPERHAIQHSLVIYTSVVGSGILRRSKLVRSR